jgi:hypothetical protein
MNPANPDMNRSAGLAMDGFSIPGAPENGKPVDIEALTERAAIMQFDGGLSRYRAERRTAELYGFTPEQREAIFPLSCRAGFEAVLFLAERGFKFIPWDDKEGRPAMKWSGDNRNSFAAGPEKPRVWSGAGYKRFMYLPGMAGFIGLDIDLGHVDGRDGLQGFYRAMEILAGKPAERLPSCLRCLPRNFPCYTRTPRGGLHLLFRYSGACKAANLNAGEYGVEVKYLNSCLSLGEKAEGVYVLYGDPLDAPELPPFLVELINPQPKVQPRAMACKQYGGKPGLEKIMDKVLTSGGGHNARQKDFAWRCAYFGYGFGETLEFVKNRPDIFGEDPDTEAVIRHAWSANTARVSV